LGDFFERECLAPQKLFEEFVVLLGRGLFEALVGFVKLGAQLGRDVGFRRGAQVQDF